MKTIETSFEIDRIVDSIMHVGLVHLQLKGDAGKSTFTKCLYGWTIARDVPCVGYDLDAQQRHFSGVYDKVNTIGIAGPEDSPKLIRVLQAIVRSELTLIDPQAHHGQLLLQTIHDTNLFNYAHEMKMRLVVPLVPRDNAAVIMDLMKIVETLKNNVEYLVVRNLGVWHDYRLYDHGPLHKKLQEYHAREIEIPRLDNAVKHELLRLETMARRQLRMEDAANDRKLGMSLLLVGTLDVWLRKVFGAFDAVADVLVPSDRYKVLKSKLQLKVAETAGLTTSADIMWGDGINLNTLEDNE